MTTIFYRVQYNDGALSLVITADRATIYAFAERQCSNRHKYPVAVIKIVLKK